MKQGLTELYSKIIHHVGNLGDFVGQPPGRLPVRLSAYLRWDQHFEHGS